MAGQSQTKVAELHPTVGEDRPVPRRLLPLRPVRNGRGELSFEYTLDPVVGGRREQPFRYVVGNPDLQGHYCDPFGLAVWRLLQHFWQVEATVEGLMRERDDAVRLRVLAEGELKRLEAHAEATKRGRGRKAGGIDLPRETGEDE